MRTRGRQVDAGHRGWSELVTNCVTGEILNEYSRPVDGD
jgi:hypothetical protein